MKNIEIAKLVADWTQVEAKNGMMLGKNPEEIITEIEAGQSVILFDEKDNPMSYCRLHTWDNQNWVEVGALVVNQEQRNQGIGSKTILEAINLAHELFPDANIFALTENPISKHVFEKLGGVQISKTQLPDEVWSLCQDEANGCKQWGIFPRCFCVAFQLNHLAKNNETK